MSTSELRIELPSSLSQEEAKLLLAVKLFEVGKVSLGQAARMAELTKRTFMEILGRYGVPVFNYSPEELRDDLRVAARREEVDSLSTMQGLDLMAPEVMSGAWRS